MARVSQTPTKDEKRRHPHADAEYRVYRLDDGGFGVEVTIPDAFPAKITSFATRKAAKQWAENHKKTVESQTAMAGRPMLFSRRVGRPPNPRPSD
jgi:hypothetical protein